jgi:hypothetical protein
MISFLAIGSREENSAMGERRLGWSEKGGRPESVYTGGSSCSRGQNLISIGSIRENMQMNLKYT